MKRVSAGLLLGLVAVALGAGVEGRTPTRAGIAAESGQIAFAVWGGDAPGLYTVNDDGTNLQLRVAGSALGDPRWSPDGSKIAFINAGPPSYHTLELWDAATRDVRVLAGCVGISSGSTNGPHISGQHNWSADSTKIATDSCSGGIVVVDVASGSTTSISTDPVGYPSWHPSRQELLLACGTNICKADLEGNLETIASVTPGIAGTPKWSPDGSHFLVPFSGGAGSWLNVFDAQGQYERTVWGPNPFFAFCSNPDWSPDGSRIAFCGNGALQIITVGSGAVQTLGTVRPTQEPWAADGSLAVEGLGVAGAPGGIYAVAPGSQPSLVVETSGDEWGATWTPARGGLTPTPTPIDTATPTATASPTPTVTLPEKHPVLVVVPGISDLFSLSCSDSEMRSDAEESVGIFSDAVNAAKARLADPETQVVYFSYDAERPMYSGCDTWQSLEKSADAFQSQFNTWKTDASRVDILAHSLGGVVVARWADQASEEDRALVQSVVAFESPLRGVGILASLFGQTRLGVFGSDLYKDFSNPDGVSPAPMALVARGLNFVPFYVVNSNDDCVVNGVAMRGIDVSHGGRVWESDVQSFGPVGGCNIVEHTKRLRAVLIDRTVLALCNLIPRRNCSGPQRRLDDDIERWLELWKGIGPAHLYPLSPAANSWKLLGAMEQSSIEVGANRPFSSEGGPRMEVCTGSILGGERLIQGSGRALENSATCLFRFDGPKSVRIWFWTRPFAGSLFVRIDGAIPVEVSTGGLLSHRGSVVVSTNEFGGHEMEVLGRCISSCLFAPVLDGVQFEQP